MNQNNIAAKREQEKRIVSLMIRTYCRGHHGTRQGLCPECQALQEYALLRADRCPFIETKTFCSNCRVHCYKPAMREKIRAVMRYSGPRMLFSHPVLVVRHGIESIREKKRLERENNEDLKDRMAAARFGRAGAWRTGCSAASSAVCAVFDAGAVQLW